MLCHTAGLARREWWCLIKHFMEGSSKQADIAQTVQGWSTVETQPYGKYIAFNDSHGTIRSHSQGQTHQSITWTLRTSSSWLQTKGMPVCTCAIWQVNVRDGSVVKINHKHLIIQEVDYRTGSEDNVVKYGHTKTLLLHYYYYHHHHRYYYY